MISLTLITSKMAYLHRQSRWCSGLQHRNSGGHSSVHNRREDIFLKSLLHAWHCIKNFHRHCFIWVSRQTCKTGNTVLILQVKKRRLREVEWLSITQHNLRFYLTSNTIRHLFFFFFRVSGSQRMAQRPLGVPQGPR